MIIVVFIQFAMTRVANDSELVCVFVFAWQYLLEFGLDVLFRDFVSFQAADVVEAQIGEHLSQCFRVFAGVVLCHGRTDDDRHKTTQSMNVLLPALQTDVKTIWMNSLPLLLWTVEGLLFWWYASITNVADDVAILVAIAFVFSHCLHFHTALANRLALFIRFSLLLKAVIVHLVRFHKVLDNVGFTLDVHFAINFIDFSLNFSHELFIEIAQSFEVVL
mmetsp:Transcript_45409/g.72621  ORF Transcript_45409/g.72621 Transcript_45409/m.72621 type:complete len:219 (-) Transcript_45409:282-938(-)